MPLWGVAAYRKNAVPQATMLYTPYPNPSRQFTDIRYQITDSREKCEMKIYDITGRLIADLSEQISVIGHQSSVKWNGTDQANRRVASGVYFVRLVAGDYSATKKVLLIR
jgi:hypothetical protein